jgi:hypothetical protein
MKLLRDESCGQCLVAIYWLNTLQHGVNNKKIILIIIRFKCLTTNVQTKQEIKGNR